MITGGGVVHRYEPRNNCRVMFESKAAEILLSGPAGTGKSRACLEKLNLLALLYPGMRGLIVRKHLSSLGATALNTWRKYVVNEAVDTGEVAFYGGSSEHPPQYRYRNGSVIVVGGIDRSTKIMSAEYDVIYVNESIELDESEWEALNTRLRNWVIPFQQILGDTNPSHEFHWLINRKSIEYFESTHQDNPELYGNDGKLTEKGKAYMAKLDNLTGVTRLRLRDGKWVAAEGVVYEEYSSSTHVIDRFYIPDEWKRLWVVDFGFTNPFVWQAWAVSPDGVLIRYKELYMTGRLVEDHAKQILDATKDDIKPEVVICDHDAEDRATLEKHLRIHTKGARKRIKTGIEAVKSRLRDKRVLFMRDSLLETDITLKDKKKPTCTEEEFPGYIYPPKSKIRDNMSEEPLKKNDHAMDTIRYVVMEEEHGSAEGTFTLTV